MNTDNKFKKWMLETYDKDELSGLAEFGAVTGFPLMCTYRQTSGLYGDFTADLWDIVAELAADYDYSIMQLMHECSVSVENDLQFKNAVVWLAAEHVACSIQRGED